MVSRSSTIAGPTIRWPSPRWFRRYTCVSTGSTPREKRTGRVMSTSPLPVATVESGSTGGASAYADSRHVTASTPTSGIVRP